MLWMGKCYCKPGVEEGGLEEVVGSQKMPCLLKAAFSSPSGCALLEAMYVWEEKAPSLDECSE